MKKQTILISLAFAVLTLFSFGEIYRISCVDEVKSSEATVLLINSGDHSSIKDGLLFYTYNQSKTSYFLISAVEKKKSIDDDLLREILVRDLAVAYNSKKLKITNIARLAVPDSTILMVGNLDKAQFVKITTTETLSDLKRKVDELLPISSSVIFRGSDFQQKDKNNRNSTRILAGDILIVPFSSTFSCGENLHRMDGKKVSLDK